MIISTTVGEVVAFQTVYRGVQYITYPSLGGFVVITHRLALGRSNSGGCKRFNSLEDVAISVKAFARLYRLTELKGDRTC